MNRSSTTKRLHIVVTLLLAAACRCGGRTAPAPTPETTTGSGDRKPATTQLACPMGPPVASFEDGVEAGPAQAAFEAFDRAYGAGRYEEALACAQEAARREPAEPASHVTRGLALEGLGDAESARDAYQRALAIDPDHVEGLRSMAELLIRRGTDDSFSAAVELARRAREHAPEAVVASDMAVLEASALNSLGRSAEALKAAESALVLDGDNSNAQVEAGVALFESVRLEESQRALERARVADIGNAKAAWFLGLLAERDGDERNANHLFSEAHRLDADAFPSPLEISRSQFDTLVQEELARLPEEQRRALATVEFSWVEIPSLEDLRAGDPVLSPTIVGLYRPGTPGRRDVILLYRKNLLRLCRSTDELRREVRDTLLHELGHLSGADDAELRDQGL